MDETLAWVTWVLARQHAPTTQILLFAAAPGRPDCGGAINRVSIPNEEKSTVVSLGLQAEDYDPFEPLFAWNRVYAVNAFYLERFRHAGFDTIDAAGALFHRRDNRLQKHDCLHVCVPGPKSLWIQLMLQWIVNSAETQ